MTDYGELVRRLRTSSEQLNVMIVRPPNGCPASIPVIDEAADAIEALSAIVDRLPRTADGHPIAPGMTLWARPKFDGDDGELLVTGVHNFRACPGLEHDQEAEQSIVHAGHDCHQECDDATPVSECYSTREAAEAASRS